MHRGEVHRTPFHPQRNWKTYASCTIFLGILTMFHPQRNWKGEDWWRKGYWRFVSFILKGIESKLLLHRILHISRPCFILKGIERSLFFGWKLKKTTYLFHPQRNWKKNYLFQSLNSAIDCFILKGIESLWVQLRSFWRLLAVSSSKELKVHVPHLWGSCPQRQVSSSKELKAKVLVSNPVLSNSCFILKGIESRLPPPLSSSN